MSLITKETNQIVFLLEMVDMCGKCLVTLDEDAEKLTQDEMRGVISATLLMLKEKMLYMKTHHHLFAVTTGELTN